MVQKRRTKRRSPSIVIEGRVQSPIEIAAPSIAALAQAIDSRMQGRKLLRELGNKIDGLGESLGEKMDRMLGLQSRMLGLQTRMLGLQSRMLGLQSQTIELQRETLLEIRKR